MGISYSSWVIQLSFCHDFWPKYVLTLHGPWVISVEIWTWAPGWPSQMAQEQISKIISLTVYVWCHQCHAYTPYTAGKIQIIFRISVLELEGEKSSTDANLRTLRKEFSTLDWLILVSNGPYMIVSLITSYLLVTIFSSHKRTVTFYLSIVLYCRLNYHSAQF